MLLAAPALLGASPPATLEIAIEGVRSARGLLQLCLTAAPRHFPACGDDPAARKRSVPASERRLSFDDLPPGTYALAIIHDENANSKLDTFAGIPKEGFGFSRNPVVRFGPPSFAQVRFPVGTAGARQTVRMKYFL